MSTISLHDLSRFTTVGALCGFDIGPVLKEVGIQVAGHDEEETPLALDTIARLFELCRQRTAKGHFPFVLGEHFAFENVPEVQAFLITSSSLREALWMLEFLPNLVQPDLVSRYRIAGEHIAVYFDLQSRNKTVRSPELIETTYVVFAKFLGQVLQGSPAHLELAFQHEPLAAIDLYQKQFGARPVFGAEHNVIRLKSELLDRALPSGSPTLHAKAQLLLETRLQRLQADHGLAGSLLLMLRHAPAIAVAEAALRLGVEPRTLQRKLKEAGTSFAMLQTQVRFDLAKGMLADRELDLDAIAAKLGFADRVSFTKAFSKWAGQPPATYRREHLT
ncbi:helix-turn-helix domain-containing protein [Luteimonas aquatica]|uniref:helix-turn-helix domain-containing protein n=1 Tax=Luteimonas aquatica TaxID=450364 RepID=UPI001F5698BA|nr:AraC family transcriptional regulator [Luteimonas aquatica]